MAEKELNLKNCSVMCVDGDPRSRRLTAGAVRKFGASNVIEVETAEQAMETLAKQSPDLALIDWYMKDSSASDLVRRIRRVASQAWRFIPIIVLSDQPRRSEVSELRDCGANLIVVKPVVPRILFSRLVWVSEKHRSFVETATYIGPDRRFHIGAIPEGGGRRHDDEPLQVGDAEEPNLSQAEIDALLRPMRADA